jgi:carboxylesterase type B
LIIGLNKDEGNFWNIYYVDAFKPHWNTNLPPTINATTFLSVVEHAFKSHSDIVQKAAAFTYYDLAPKYYDPQFYTEQINQMVGDYFFTCDALWMADQVSNTNTGQVFVYLFNEVNVCRH